MKGLDRITNLRLAEILSQNGILSREEMGDAIAAQESSMESFVSVLISAGYLTEWELARLVAEYFQLPFLQGERYEIQKDVVSLLEEDFLFNHMVLPLDKFGKVLTVVMPIMVPGEILEKIQIDKGFDVFPIVGLYSENKKKLYELYPDHPKEEVKTKKSIKEEFGKAWETIFDLGDEAVKKDLHSGLSSKSLDPDPD